MSLSRERLLLEEQETHALLSGRRFPQADSKKTLLNIVGEAIEEMPVEPEEGIAE